MRRSSDHVSGSLWRYKAQYRQRRNKSNVPHLPEKTFYAFFKYHKRKRETDPDEKLDSHKFEQLFKCYTGKGKTGSRRVVKGRVII